MFQPCPGSEGTSTRRPMEEPEVLLNASTGGAGPLPVITTLLADPISIVSTTIDVSEMSNPSVLLTFTGIISLPLGIAVTLNFQINRSTDDSASRVGGTYTFSKVVSVLESESFSFQFFDADIEPDTYTYQIQLSTNSIIDVTPGLTILNATLSALAVNR